MTGCNCSSTRPCKEDARREESVEDAAGLKFSATKPALGLVSGEFICHMGAVLTFGRDKYTRLNVDGANNWRRGIAVTELIAAVLRHTFLALMGEENDKESGHPHLAHAAVDAMMAWETIKYRPFWDDRWKQPFEMPVAKENK